MLEANISVGAILAADERSRGRVPDGICTLLFPVLQLLTIVKNAA